MTYPAPDVRDHAPPGTERLLAGLTPAQAQAVTHGAGPLLLIAGPGAGKTRTLTHRIAHLLRSGRARPQEILAVTFSVRAASELRLRLADLLDEQIARAVTAATFHSVCARLLREHAHLFGRSAQYTIYDQGDVRRVIETLLADQRQAEIQAAVHVCGLPAPGDLQAEISLAKNRLLDPDTYSQRAAHPAAALVAGVWREAELELERSNAFDFDDLISCAVALLERYPQQRYWLGRRCRWLLVDEYQDTNLAQAQLVWLLAGAGGNVCVVADEDQLIHSWRGASVDQVLGFAQRYPDHARIVLAENFRSRAEILDTGLACVSHNQRRTPKALSPVRGRGGRVQVASFGQEWQEAHWIGRAVAEAIAAGTPGPEILVLARTGHASGPVQLALARAGIPHRVLGSLGLYERAEVRDALAYLTLLVNPADAQAFGRAVRSPRRGVGAATVDLLVSRARASSGGDLICVCAGAHTLAAIRGEAVRDRIASFGEGLGRIRGELAAGRSLGHAVLATVMLPGGLVEHYELRRDTAADQAARLDAERVLEDLRSLCRAAQAFEEEHGAPAPLRTFLEHAAGLHAQQLPSGEDLRVTVSTIHRAKGTEATLVILLGCEEQLLPSWQSLTSEDPEQLAEERRLFYVAATRAKDRLVLTYAEARDGRPTGGPSRFLAEAGLYDATKRQAA